MMKRFDNILYPTDFSTCSEHAKEYAIALASNTLYSLHIAHVVDSSSIYSAGMDASGGAVAEVLSVLERQANDNLDKIVDSAKTLEIKATKHLLHGRPDVEIVRLADELQSGLIVIGTHGRSGFSKLVFGSTCEKIVRNSRVPVLAIKEPEHEFVKGGELGFIGTVLCPTDLSEFSKEGIELGASLCRECGSTLKLLYVMDNHIGYGGYEYIEGPHDFERARGGARARLEELAAEISDVPVEIEVIEGTPHREIIRYVDKQDVDITVMATHGRTGISHALLGSTTEKVVRLAPCPVLTIRPNATAIPQREGAESQERAGV